MKKNRHAVALGKKGARLGGLARAAKLSPGRRSEIARKAARGRWAAVTAAIEGKRIEAVRTAAAWGELRESFWREMGRWEEVCRTDLAARLSSTPVGMLGRLSR